MNINRERTITSILPYFNIIKNKNPLTLEARKSFNYEWEDYYSFEFGWFKWHFEI